MKKKKVNSFEFGITRILDCGFMIEEAIPAEPNKITLGYGLNLVIDLNDNWIQFIVKAAFNHVNYPSPLSTATVLTKFTVKNLSSYLNKENKMEFPINSIETLFGISFGHLRAIMAKNLAGTRHQILYLPVINQYDLFNGLLSDNIRLINENPELFSTHEVQTLAMFYQPEPSKDIITG